MSSSVSHPLLKFLPDRPIGPMRSPARVLGWFSVALGLAELAMPRQIARMTGAPGSPALIRAYGLREIGVGAGLILARDPQPWLWARVAGDVLDMATVGSGAWSGARPLRTLVSLALLAGITAVDAQTANAAAPRPRQRSLHDYSGQSGFPKPVAQMRGAANKSFAHMGAERIESNLNGARSSAVSGMPPA